MRGVPAISRMNVSILSLLYARQDGQATPLSGQSPPGNATAALKMLSVFPVVGIGFSPDLDMSFQHGAGKLIQTQHLAFAGAGPYPSREPKLSSDSRSRVPGRLRSLPHCHH